MNVVSALDAVDDFKARDSRGNPGESLISSVPCSCLGWAKL